MPPAFLATHYTLPATRLFFILHFLKLGINHFAFHRFFVVASIATRGLTRARLWLLSLFLSVDLFRQFVRGFRQRLGFRLKGVLAVGLECFLGLFQRAFDF